MTTMAMTQNFVRLATEDTESDFLEFKQFKEEKIIKAEEIDRFDYTIFKWYHGYTLACRSNGVYDLYRVYDKWHLILETEDPVVELPIEPKDIVVKAYDRYKDDKLIQLGLSWSQVELPSRDKSSEYKLSVIVPLYNSELFMCRTIDAILSNSLDNIELILINDGSTDNTKEIAKHCGYYSERDCKHTEDPRHDVCWYNNSTKNWLSWG